MKTWEKPVLSMVDVSNTEHDFYGENWDGSYIETVEGEPITNPIQQIVGHLIPGGDYTPPTDDPVDDVVNRRS
jgi:hypothetical protein